MAIQETTGDVAPHKCSGGHCGQISASKALGRRICAACGQETGRHTHGNPETGVNYSRAFIELGRAERKLRSTQLFSQPRQRLRPVITYLSKIYYAMHSAKPALRSTLDFMDLDATDESLMLAYAKGDSGAFEILYGRHRGALFRFLLRQVKQSATAEELYQDIWQRVISARSRYQPQAKFSTWLYQIASNRLTDHWRAQKHRPSAGDSEAAAIAMENHADEHNPERELSIFEQRRRVQLAIEALPDEQRETVILRLEQELSLEEIGEITGVGRETVKSRLRYAMDKLRAALGCQDSSTSINARQMNSNL